MFLCTFGKPGTPMNVTTEGGGGGGGGDWDCDGVEGLDALVGGNIMYPQYTFTFGTI